MLTIVKAYMHNTCINIIFRCNLRKKIFKISNGNETQQQLDAIDGP